MESNVTRRRLATGALVAVPSAILATWFRGPVTRSFASGSPSPVPSETPVASFDAPDWTIAILSFLDPYPRPLKTPASPYPDMPQVRYIGLEVLFENKSTLPLDLRPTDIHLHDRDGFDYTPASGVAGVEPRLQGQTIPPGRRARGWLWYAVPIDAELDELRVDAPPAELSQSLAGISIPPSERTATPVVSATPTARETPFSRASPATRATPVR